MEDRVGGKTKRKIRLILIVVAIILAATTVLLGVATMLLNTDYVQQRLLRRATALLTEQLGTRVEVGSVNVNLFNLSMALHNLSIDDQQNRPLLRLKQLTAEASMESLWEQRFVVNEVKAEGLEARLVKAAEDSAANYQFLIDAVRKKKEAKQKDNPKGKQDKKWNVELHPKHLRLKDTRISYQLPGKTTTAALRRLDVRRQDRKHHFDLTDLHVTTDNHQPRKNADRPKRGSFDMGHLDATATLRGTVHLVNPDSICLTLNDGTIQDPAMGFDISDLNLNATTNRKVVRIASLSFRQGTTTLQVSHANIALPNQEAGQELAYEAKNITGHVVLHDIAKPFAPVLREFHLPLQLSAQMSGTADKMTFSQVHVCTDDHRLDLTAHGHIDHLREKQQYAVSFDVERLLSKQGMAEKVVNQFVVKKLMMNELRRLGDINYRGHFDVRRQGETFRGRLTTNAGNLDFHFSIDTGTDRVKGHFSSAAILVGKVMDMPSIGDVDMQAEFDIDISKQRTARMRRLKGGSLPIGTANATVNECSYKRIHLKNITVSIQSDGANAEGDVVQQNSRRQLYTHFIYNEQDPKHKLRITNAGIHFGKKNSKTAQQ